LDWGIKNIKELLGVEPVYGGSHPGRGTHNALLGLGDQVYLEIIAPDPEQSQAPRPLWMGVDQITQPRLITWAAKSEDLNRLSRTARDHHITLGMVSSGSRTQLNGLTLRWELTEPVNDNLQGLVPFFIDWGKSSHPASALPLGGSLVSLKACHPEPSKIKTIAQILDFDLPAQLGDEISLIAEIQTNTGIVELV